MLKLILLLICFNFVASEVLKPTDVRIYVLSANSNGTLHTKRRDVFRKALLKQMDGNLKDVTIEFLNTRNGPGESFVYSSILLKDKDKNDAKWTLFCHEETRFDFKIFFEFLSASDSNQPHFIGYALQDKQHTIIHHFDDPKAIMYPDVWAGFVLSKGAVSGMMSHWEKKANDIKFHIDVNYELAKSLKTEMNISLENITGFCITPRHGHCFSWISKRGILPQCNKPVDIDDVVFAVKTCQSFFEDRIPVIKSTWAPKAKHILYFADVKNDIIPTIFVGIPNTEKGHCEKLIRIMRHIRNDPVLQNKKYLFIADDDTLVNVDRLLSLIGCYSDEEKLALGERYGFFNAKGHGYEYITGGGGMLLSMSVVRELLDENIAHCQNHDDPDDMKLGMWLQQLDIPIIHSHLIHQARPYDYSSHLLSHQSAVSFHKFWACDPNDVYFIHLSGDKKRKKTDMHEEL